MKEIILNKNSDINKRFEILTKLFNNAEKRILHSDTFRQNNLHYTLVIFAGLFALGLKTKGIYLHASISAALFILMFLLTTWDRRWHKTKHGWEKSCNEFRKKLVELVNNPNNDICFFPYYVDEEKTAESNSLLPKFFYLLTAGSIASFFIFELLEKYATKI